MNFCSHLVQLPGWTKYLGKWASHKLHIEYSIRYSGSCLHRFDLFWIQQILCMLLYQFFSENGPQWIHMKFFLNYLSSADIKCDILISKHMLIHGFMSKSGVGKENKDHKRNNDKQFTIYHSIIFYILVQL